MNKQKKFQRTLEKRRTSLEKNLDARNKGKAVAKSTPSTADIDLIYPLYDQLDNYIVFQTRAREARDGKNGKNLLSKDNVEIALYVRPEHLASNFVVNYKTQGFGAGIRGIMDMHLTVEKQVTFLVTVVHWNNSVRKSKTWQEM